MTSRQEEDSTLAKVFGGSKITSQADPTTLPEPAEGQEQHREAELDRNG